MKIKAYLKKAQLWDIFNSSENIYPNLPLFYLSQIDGEFYGPYFSHSQSDHLELFLKCSIGMIYKLNFNIPGGNDIPIKLELNTAAGHDLKESSNTLQIGLPYYIKNTADILGPYFLNKESIPQQLNSYLKSKRMYIIKTNQKINLLNTQNVAV